MDTDQVQGPDELHRTVVPEDRDDERQQEYAEELTDGVDWYDTPIGGDEDLYGDIDVSEYLGPAAEQLFEDTFYDVEGLDDGLYVAADEDEGVAITYAVSTDEDAGEYPEVTVKVHDMPDGLFGFTDPSKSSDMQDVHINSNLYETDQDTVEHEKEHVRNPGKDELQIRYLNGDLDPQFTASLAHTRHDSPHASMAYDAPAAPEPGQYGSC